MILRHLMPVSDKQFESIDSESIDTTERPVRFMANGQNMNVCIGTVLPKGTNIIHQFVYWDRPKAWTDRVLECLKRNNPDDIQFTVRKG